MSNFSNIGFHVNSEEEFYALVERAYHKSSYYKTKNGTYYHYSDESGAELWIQTNGDDEFIGVNPHYKGRSKRRVSITESINRPESVLDGAFHSWADPIEKDNFENGVYPFVFDVPNHKQYDDIEIPQLCDIQLCAFAQDFEYYESENSFVNAQKGGAKWSSQSFVPITLFNTSDENKSNPEALGLFAGIVTEVELKKNHLTEQNFYWLFVKTLGGEVDVLVAQVLFENTIPRIGGVIHGEFWLAGILISRPKIKKKKSFFQKYFWS